MCRFYRVPHCRCHCWMSPPAPTSSAAGRSRPPGCSCALGPQRWVLGGFPPAVNPLAGVNPGDESPLALCREQGRRFPAAQGKGSHRAPAAARKLLTQRSALLIETVMQRNQIINQPCCFFPCRTGTAPALLAVELVFHVVFPPWSVGLGDKRGCPHLPLDACRWLQTGAGPCRGPTPLKCSPPAKKSWRNLGFLPRKCFKDAGFSSE